ncbi:Potassium channel [Xylographa parallela]|nr:Potassium channel [Xylographa parallela]
MNDPGLDKPISDDAKNLERVKETDGDDEMEDDQTYMDPSRWWFASTAFPLLAGTFGPIASAFNICALVQHWRVSIPPGGTEEHGIDVPDPSWLIAINAVSLVIALLANMSLLFNMARRLSFSIAQPITIVGWYISSFLLIGLLATASHSPSMELTAAEDRAFTQAFYYAIMAAGLYIIVASLMVITVYGAYAGHYPREFKLTMSQRTLMLQTISYLVYLESGAAVFAHIEGWMFVDGVYWANYTLLTIGLGDYSPSTHLGRSLLFPFAVGGIIILGLVIGSIRSLVLERGKKKLGARMIEKKRQAYLKKLERKKKGRATITPLSEGQGRTSDGKTEKERREEEFNMMRKIQDEAMSRRRWTALAISATAWLFLWLVGAMVFWKAEKNQQWTYFGAVYFAYVSLLTIGYGDFTPESNSGKAFYVFWALLAIPTLTILISNMGDTVVKMIRDLTLWLGEFTVLPGEGGTKDRIRKGARNVKEGILNNSNGAEEEAPGFIGEANHDTEKGEGQPKHNAETDAANDKLAGDFENAEMQEADDDAAEGDEIGKDIHLYHYLLVKEIRRVMPEIGQTPPKKYSYHEWAWFLRLMGEDENSTKFHRKAPVKEATVDGPQMQKAVTDINNDESVSEQNQWSWLGARSPLMGDTEEAEWVLERLSMTLERELRKQRDQQKGADSDMKKEGLQPGKDGRDSDKGTKDESLESREVSDKTDSRASSNTYTVSRHGTSERKSTS